MREGSKVVGDGEEEGDDDMGAENSDQRAVCHAPCFLILSRKREGK